MNENLTLGTYQGLLCHHWNDELPLVANVLSAVRPMLVVEIGTMYGGFAAFLADAVKPWGGRVVTVDRVIYPGLEAALADRENLCFVRADVNSGFAVDLIRTLMQECSDRDERTCLYADAQPGREEFFSLGHLADLAGVHDYGTEVEPERLEDWATEYRRLPYRHGAFEALQDAKGGYFVSRFWVVPELMADLG